jgi:choline monooxygenase
MSDAVMTIPDASRVDPVARQLQIDPVEVDDLLSAGYTMPAELYTDPRVAELEDRWIWQRTWSFAGLLQDLREPGDYLTTRVGSVPVVVVCNEREELRAFINVCRHRGFLAAEGKGNRKSIQCRYHGWVYDLNGCLRTMPRAAEVENFEEFGLLPAQVDSWAGMVFVSIEPRESLTGALGQLPALQKAAGLVSLFELHDDWVRVEDSIHDHIHANWKIVIENALECYHCPTSHTHTFSEVYNVDAEGFTYQNFDRGVYHLANFTSAFAKRHSREEHEKQPRLEVADYLFFFLWPAIGVLGAGNPEDTEATISRRIPVAHDHTITQFMRFRRKDAPETADPFRAEMGQMLRKTLDEDIELCQRIHAGLACGKVRFGKTVPDSEANIRHFQRLTWDALAPAFSGM